MLLLWLWVLVFAVVIERGSVGGRQLGMRAVGQSEASTPKKLRNDGGKGADRCLESPQLGCE